MRGLVLRVTAVKYDTAQARLELAEEESQARNWNGVWPAVATFQHEFATLIAMTAEVQDHRVVAQEVIC